LRGGACRWRGRRRGGGRALWWAADFFPPSPAHSLPLHCRRPVVAAELTRCFFFCSAASGSNYTFRLCGDHGSLLAATWDGLLACRGSRRWRSAIDRVEIAGAVPKIWSHLPRAQWSLPLRRIRTSDPIPSSVLKFRLFEITSTPATKFVRIPAGCLHFLWVIYIVIWPVLVLLSLMVSYQ
jgi:hypothetical protein